VIEHHPSRRRVLGRFAVSRVLIAAGLCALCPVVSGQEEEAAPQKFKKAVLIPFDGTITPLLEQFLYRHLEDAREQQADLVILRIDSPGGLLDESLRIAERLQALDWARTVAYVPKEALSGAAIAALGCDEIVMHPHARLGDAGPIFLAEDALFRHAPEKLMSDLAVKIRRLASAKGRPPALAEAMVDRNCEVFPVTNRKTGELTYMSEAEIASLKDAEDWEKGKLVFESRRDHFLEVEGERAVELKLASATVENLQQLQQRYQWDELVTLEQTWVDTLVYVLNHSWVTGLLLVVGLICLYVEFSMPSGIAATISALCFVLFFWSRVLGGTAGWLEVVLFLFGLALVLVEIFLLPGFGFAGITGAVFIVAALVMASQRFVIPRTTYDLGELIDTFAMLVGSGIGFLVLAFLLRRHFHMIPAFNSLVLAPPEPEPMTAAVAAPVKRDRQWLVGREGVTTTPLRPAGRARFEGEQFDVFAEGSYIPPGRTVRVVEILGSRVMVVEVEGGAGAT
jgi:membrane-bound serine protease (ClpP class)